MVMRLEAQCDLREEDLEEDVRDPRAQDYLNIRIIKNIVYLNTRSDYQNSGFLDKSGFDLEKGILHLGDIQFERPSVKILRGSELPPTGVIADMEGSWDKRVRRIPALFAIERLFRKPLSHLEVTRFFCDLTESSAALKDGEKALIDTEMEKYRKMLSQSETGKPLIEADYNARRWTSHESGVNKNMLYGERIHELLQEKL
jgi:hypothetical protein